MPIYDLFNTDTGALLRSQENMAGAALIPQI
jgi:hypothetical protein